MRGPLDAATDERGCAVRGVRLVEKEYLCEDERPCNAEVGKGHGKGGETKKPVGIQESPRPSTPKGDTRLHGQLENPLHSVP